MSKYSISFMDSAAMPNREIEAETYEITISGAIMFWDNYKCIVAYNLGVWKSVEDTGSGELNI